MKKKAFDEKLNASKKTMAAYGRVVTSCSSLERMISTGDAWAYYRWFQEISDVPLLLPSSP